MYKDVIIFIRLLKLEHKATCPVKHTKTNNNKSVDDQFTGCVPVWCVLNKSLIQSKDRLLGTVEVLDSNRL